MPVAVGTKAPDFTLPAKVPAGPKHIRLSDNFGHKNTLLLFFPMAFTGTCTTEMCEVSAGMNEYIGLNAAVYGISGDNPFAQEAWAQKENIVVPLLSDYEHKVAKAYDVMYDSFLPQMNLGMGGVPKRSAFIIDKNGVIQYAESNDDARQLPNFEKIKAKLEELAVNEIAPAKRGTNLGAHLDLTYYAGELYTLGGPTAERSELGREVTLVNTWCSKLVVENANGKRALVEFKNIGVPVNADGTIGTVKDWPHSNATDPTK